MPDSHDRSKTSDNANAQEKTRAALDLWLVDQIARAGGPSEQAYFAHGKNLSLAAEALSLASQGLSVTRSKDEGTTRVQVAEHSQC